MLLQSLHSYSRTVAFAFLLGLASLLASCDTLGNVLGSDSRGQKPLPGNRVAVLDYRSNIATDPLLAEASLLIPSAQTNRSHTGQMALQQAGIENLKISGLSRTETAEAGDGASWENNLIPAPIVGGDVLFAVDSVGTVSAHDTADISRVLWQTSTSLNDELESTAGGGLAYNGGVVYVTTGHGSVIALVAADGSLLWRQESGVPIRAAPTASEEQIYAITIDNQLTAFSARTGRIQWTHRGIREASVYLGSAAPVVENDIVIAAYSSGELVALKAEDGQPLWADSLIASKRTSASAVLTGISATPLVRDNIVYAVSDNGLMVASLLSSGRGLWDLELSSFHTPWFAGGYIFIISAENNLMALRAKDGRVKWSRSVLLDKNGEMLDTEDLPTFTAPMIVNGRLLLVRSDGEMLWYDPNNGTLLEQTDAPKGVFSKPVIAGERLYLLDQDATLHQYQ